MQISGDQMTPHDRVAPRFWAGKRRKCQILNTVIETTSLCY